MEPIVLHPGLRFLCPSWLRLLGAYCHVRGPAPGESSTKASLSLTTQIIAVTASEASGSNTEA